MKRILALTAAGGLLSTALMVVPTLSTPGEDSALSPLAYSAAVDYFLKLEGVEGESTDEQHSGQIEIDSFSWGVSQTTRGGGGGGGAGKASFQDFHFTKRIDKASPLLFQSVPQGIHLKEAVLTGRKAGGDRQDFFIVKFTDVLISSFQQSGSPGDVPTEQVSLNFAKIEFSYLPQNPDGTQGAPVKGCWDLKANKKC